MDDIATLLDLLARGSVVTALGFALFGGHRGWYVWGRTHENELAEKDKTIADRDATIKELKAENEKILQKLEGDRNYWRDIALRVLTANEQTLSKVVDMAQKQG